MHFFTKETIMKKLRIFLLFCAVMLLGAHASTTVCMERRQAITTTIKELATALVIAFTLRKLQQKRLIAKFISGIPFEHN